MKYSFIVRQEHIDKYGIDKEIKAIIPHANIFAVQGNDTRCGRDLFDGS